MSKLEDELKITSFPKGRQIVPGRPISREEILLDKYVDEELAKLGYYQFTFDDDFYSKAYNREKYMKAVSIARGCLKKGIEIPADVKKYMLQVKKIKEGR